MKTRQELEAIIDTLDEAVIAKMLYERMDGNKSGYWSEVVVDVRTGEVSTCLNQAGIVETGQYITLAR